MAKNTLSTGIDYKSNSLQLIKYIAAFSVLWTHTISHCEIDVPDWLNSTISFFYGVPLFFAISGFTLWLSFEKNADFKLYFKKRFFRIYPELWIGVIVSAIILIILYPQVRSLSGITSLGVFSLTQGTFMQFWTPGALRGYGVGTPNGSLWTICTLIQFYILAIFFFKFIRNKKIYWWFIFFALSVGAQFISPYLYGFLPETVCKLYGQLILGYFWFFLTGMFIAKYKDKIIPFLKRFWYLFIAANLMIRFIGVDLDLSYPLLKSILLIAGVIGFAYATPFIKINYDCAYGIYIYHMIVVNVFVHLGIVGHRWLILTVIALTVIASIGSTYAGKLIRKKFETKPLVPSPEAKQ